MRPCTATPSPTPTHSLTGIALAAEVNRSLVLPDFLLSGMINTSMPITARDAFLIPFAEWFDQAAFVSTLQQHGLRIVTPNRTYAVQHISVIPTEQFSHANNKLIEVLQHHSHDQHIRLHCPCLRVPAALIVKHRALVIAALRALRPAPKFATIVTTLQRRIRLLSKHMGNGDGAFNLLHLRLERDWIAHCSEWQRQKGNNNCATNTERVGEVLAEQGFEKRLPLVVVTAFPHAVPKLLQAALSSLRAQNYTLVLSKHLVQEGDELRRGEGALVRVYRAVGICGQGGRA